MSPKKLTSKPRKKFQKWSFFNIHLLFYFYSVRIFFNHSYSQLNSLLLLLLLFSILSHQYVRTGRQTYCCSFFRYRFSRSECALSFVLTAKNANLKFKFKFHYHCLICLFSHPAISCSSVS